MLLLTASLLYQKLQKTPSTKQRQLYRITAEICCGNSRGAWAHEKHEEEQREQENYLPELTGHIFFTFGCLNCRWLSDRK